VRWNAIRPHLDFLFDLAMRETGRAQDAEDVVQDVATSALRARDPDMPRAYLAGAVLLRARQVRRGETRRRAREAALVPPGPPALPDRAALVRDEIEHALVSLEPDERRAVVLRHLHDLGYDEIGAALGISAAAARQRVHRGLTRLRERFGPDGEASLALLPLFVAPRALFPKPLLGALLMKMTTKAAVAVLALAAGAAVGAATTRRAPAPSVPVLPQAPPPPPKDDIEGLRAELAKYPPLEDADLIVYSATSLRGKLAAIDELPEDARVEAVRRIGERIQRSGKGVDEALALLRDESDPRVLFWLADVLRFLTLQRVPIPERPDRA
jgi:RNA polymerase sigma factor (sigma-70 family)